MPNLLSGDNPVSIVLPPILWSLYFLAVYVAHALACAKGWPAGVVDMSVALATVLTVAALAGLSWLYWSRFRPLRGWDEAIRSKDPEVVTKGRQRFMALAGLMQAGLAIVATLMVGMPTLLVPRC